MAMNWYSPTECENTVEDPYVADIADLKDYNEWDFTYGRRFKNWDRSVTFGIKKPANDGVPDDVLQTVSCLPIYSPRLQAALKKGGIRGIQYLPVQVLRYDGSSIEGFTIANILNLVPCLDWIRTDYRADDKCPSEILSYRFGTLVVHRSALEGHDILRMAEFKLDYFVSDRFKNIFEDGGFTGYSFSPIKLSD